MFGPGPFELLIIGIILIVPLAGTLAIIFALLYVLKIGPFQPNNPNLHPCPDCGHRVSVRATNCPKCGCPLEQKA